MSNNSRLLFSFWQHLFFCISDLIQTVKCDSFCLTALSAPLPFLCLWYGALITALSHSLFLCFLVFHQIATARANVHVTALPWDRRWLHCECERKEEKEIDCFQIAQAPKKRDTLFHFLPGLWEKMQAGGKECRGRGWGNYWEQCKEVKFFSVKTCLKGSAEAWKVSQRKI